MEAPVYEWTEVSTSFSLDAWPGDWSDEMIALFIREFTRCGGRIIPADRQPAEPAASAD